LHSTSGIKRITCVCGKVLEGKDNAEFWAKAQALTDAYTGRPAGGARTPFVAELAGWPPPAPYAVQRCLTDDFRGIDGYGWYLGGETAPLARELPAAELVATLAAETAAGLG
jgi:nitronate monooxygenase